MLRCRWMLVRSATHLGEAASAIVEPSRVGSSRVEPLSSSRLLLSAPNRDQEGPRAKLRPGRAVADDEVEDVRAVHPPVLEAADVALLVIDPLHHGLGGARHAIAAGRDEQELVPRAVGAQREVAGAAALLADERGDSAVSEEEGRRAVALRVRPGSSCPRNRAPRPLW